MRVFKEGMEGWRKFFFPTKIEMLEEAFGTLTKPPPVLLEKMLGISYPNWQKMARVLSTFWTEVPEPHGRFFAPIHDLVAVHRVANRIVNMLLEDMTDAEKKHILTVRLSNNLEEVTKRFKSDKTVYPAHFQGNKKDLIAAYFKNTPFYELFHHSVNYQLPIDERLVHTMIVASSRAGKSYLIESQILADAQMGYAAIVIDPKDDDRGLWYRLPRHSILRDRMVFIDPDQSPGINIFDTESEDFELLYGSYEYFFKSLLKDDLSAPMQNYLRPVLALCSVIPGATVETIIEVMKDPRKFEKYFPKLGKAELAMLTEEKVDQRTKDTLRARVRSMQTGKFGRMFTAAENKIKLRQWIDQRKIVVIHSSMNKLGNTFATFGRYFVAESLRAARTRKTFHPCFLYVDEAAFFFDESTDQVLHQMSAYRFGGVFAFQDWEQAQRARIADALWGNTQVKIFGGHNDEDSAMFSSKFYPNERVHLPTLPKGSFYSRVAGKTPVVIQVPLITEQLMSEEEYKTFEAENRELLTSREVERKPEEKSGPVKMDELPLD